MLGFLGSKVLGQFDPFHEAPEEHGRMLLVAPNIVHTERELEADPHDFRLWVCLHEETHRVQFTAVPWMTDHLRSEMGDILGSVQTDPSELLGDAVRKVGDLVSGKSDGSLIDLFSTPEQKAVIERVTGVMSLLEGHADVVMDGVGPEVIPTVADIRRKFTERRKGVGTLDKLLRRLLGLDQKMAQYRDGASSCAPLSTRSAWRASTRSGPSRPTCRPSRRSSTRRSGSPGSTAESCSLHPSVAAVRLAVRRTLADLDPGDTVVVACSGGADSLALLAATVFEATERFLAGDRRHRRPRAAGRVGRARRPGRRADADARRRPSR